MYFLKINHRWFSFNYTDYIANAGKKAPTSAGVLEIFGMMVQIAWTTNDGRERHVDAMAAPGILENANASVCFAAVNDILPAVSLGSITSICATQKCMWVVEVPDGVSYIKRMVYSRGGKLPSNVFYPIWTCAAHRLHRIGMKAVDEEEGCGDTHAVAFVNQQFSRKAEIKSNGKSIIGDEIDVVFWHAAGCNPGAHATYTGAHNRSPTVRRTRQIDW